MGCQRLTYHKTFSPLKVVYNDLNINSNTSLGDYRYGFQGQEKDDEVKGEGNSINYKYRMHDPRVGRFFAVDPLVKSYPSWSPYLFSGNNPVLYVDYLGLGPGDPPTDDGTAEGGDTQGCFEYTCSETNSEEDGWDFSTELFYKMTIEGDENEQMHVGIIVRWGHEEKDMGGKLGGHVETTAGGNTYGFSDYTDEFPAIIFANRTSGFYSTKDNRPEQSVYEENIGLIGQESFYESNEKGSRFSFFLVPVTKKVHADFIEYANYVSVTENQGTPIEDVMERSPGYAVLGTRCARGATILLEKSDAIGYIWWFGDHSPGPLRRTLTRRGYLIYNMDENTDDEKYQKR